MKKNISSALCLLFLLLCSLPLWAQQTQSINGRVVDQNGEPIVGASVVVDGTTKGTVTDNTGAYSLNVPQGASVSVSFIGFDNASFAIEAGKNTYDVVLNEEYTAMDEVVIVGYGVQKKATLTGSVSTVKTEEISDISSGGLGSTLTGLINGLSVSGGNGRPGENARIYMRDTNSLSEVGSTSQEPLYVIDGYIYPNDIKVGNTTQNYGSEAFNNLDPSVIESISVLKDASAAVYGARAANGVILVTTKKGQMGAPTISYAGNFGITNAVAKPKMLSAYDYGRMYNAYTAADPTNTSLNRKTSLFQQDELDAMKDLKTDLLQQYWNTGLTQQHSVTLSGATDKASYFAGMSFFDQEGNLGKLDYSRWNYRAGVDLTIAQWLKASFSVSGDNGKKDKPLVKIGGSNAEKDYLLLLTHPYYIPEYVAGKPIATCGPASNSTSNNNQYYHFNTLQNNGDYSKTVNQNTTFNAGLEYDFGWNEYTKGLKLKLSFSKSISTDKTNEYASDFTIYTLTKRSGSGEHIYTPVDGQDYGPFTADDNLVPHKLSNGDNAYLYRTTTRTDNYQLNFTATYNCIFGKNSVSALFSIEKGEAESEYLEGKATDPYDFTTGQSNSVKSSSTKTTVFTRSESGTLSYIGRLNYDYDGKYLAEFLLRADASTKFAPNNYWGKFPSASVGWIISQEEWFYDKVSWMDFLKIRASFGLTGRDNTAAWQWMQVYAQDANKGVVFGTSPSTESGNRITINKNNSAVNSDIHWDKTYKGNAGIDLHFLDNSLSVTIDAYKNWNREMLMNVSQLVPTTVGTQSAATNLGEMDSWGVEFDVNWSNRIGKDFKYSIGISTGYTDNKVINMDFVAPSDDAYYRSIHKDGRSDVGTWGMHCIGMFRSFQDINEYFDKYNITTYMGMSRDKVRPGMLIYKDVRGAANGDGTYAPPDGIVDNEKDQVQLANRSNPYGFTTNLKCSWRSFSLSAQLFCSWGGYSFVPSSALKFSNSIEYTNVPSFWNPDNMFVYNDIVDGSGNVVLPQNREGSMPNLAYASVNSVNSSFWRVSGTRAGLRRLTLAYAFPKDFLKVMHVKNARINVTGQNLLSFNNPFPDDFIDPMMDYGRYPTLRKWTIGLNVSF